MGRKSVIFAPETMKEAEALAKRIATGKTQKGDATRASKLFGIETRRSNKRAVFMALTRALGDDKNETAALGISVVRHVAPQATVHLSSHPNGTAAVTLLAVQRRNSIGDGIKGVTSGAAIIAALVLWMALEWGLTNDES
jgi:hypothetical protein